MSKELTKKQAAYVKNRGAGMPRDKAAVAAGYADVKEQGKVAERSADVRAALVEEARKYEGAGDMSRQKVMDGLLAAANMAQIMADPQAMVAAWREIAKICGYYAPETKRVEHMLNTSELKGALELLSDAELLQIKRGRTLDGEAKRLPAPADM